MRSRTMLVPSGVACAVALLATAVLAQTPDLSAPSGQACTPPDNPTVGSNSGRELGDQLAQSKGVICPPPTGDRAMPVTPPGDGKLRVIPPPGSPGGDQNVQPK